MRFLRDKRIVLGVTGGVAAYKAAELVRVFKKAGADVRVVMTDAARDFVGAATFQALSGHPVHTRFSDDPAAAGAGPGHGMSHIELARWADRVVVAPATADFIARIAAGIADDPLTALWLCADAPRALAPAMNARMWANRQTRLNVEHLRGLGVAFVGPADGEQACGEVGPGRMLEPQDIARTIDGSFADDEMAGLKVMVTAGPTREAIDVARYISNRSSGKMGFALARAAREAAASVTLVAGPVALETPAGVSRVDVESARQMGDAVLQGAAAQDILIGAAAVADYAPTAATAGKIKKTNRDTRLDLTPAIDILREVGQLRKRPFTVGFAAETDNLAENALAKMRDKNMDMVAANEVGAAGGGFESDDNALQVYWPGGGEFLARAAKDKIARRLIAIIARQYRQHRRARK